jgi:hypothetical protein
MPADIRAALTLVSERFGVENKEPCFRVQITGLSKNKRLAVLEHDLFKERVRLAQPLRVWLIQVTAGGLFSWH